MLLNRRGFSTLPAVPVVRRGAGSVPTAASRSPSIASRRRCAATTATTASAARGVPATAARRCSGTGAWGRSRSRSSWPGGFPARGSRGWTSTPPARAGPTTASSTRSRRGDGGPTGRHPDDRQGARLPARDGGGRGGRRRRAATCRTSGRRSAPSTCSPRWRAARGAGPSGGRVIVQTRAAGPPRHRARRAARRAGLRDGGAARAARPAVSAPRGAGQRRLSGQAEEAVADAAVALGRGCARCWRRAPTSAATVLGPAPCPIERIRDRWRWHLLVKAPDDARLTRLVGYVAARAPVPAAAAAGGGPRPGVAAVNALNARPSYRRQPSRVVPRRGGPAGGIELARSCPYGSAPSHDQRGRCAVSEALARLLEAVAAEMPRRRGGGGVGVPAGAARRARARRRGREPAGRRRTGAGSTGRATPWGCPGRSAARSRWQLEQAAEGPPDLVPVGTRGRAAPGDEAGDAELVDLTAWKAALG